MATDINILIKATDQASPAIKKVEGELKQVGTTAKNSSSLMSGFGNVMKAGLTTALVGVAGAVGGLAFAFKDSFAAAKEAQDAQKQLVAVLNSTGQAAGVTTTMALDLANSLSLVTNFGDDAIVSGENLLLTFTGIGKDVFPRATETMLDMSQALGQDLSSSAVQLGKALNDPINGMTALSRVGVSFTDQQKEMITTMQEAGDVAGAQTVILDELAKEFGGSAKALADPFVQLQNQWGEVQEAVGNGLLPVLNDLARNALPYVQAAAQAVGLGFQTFYDALDDGKGPLEAARQAIADMLPEDLKQKWLDLSGDIAGALNTIVGNIQNAMGWIKLAWDTGWADMKTTWDTFKVDVGTDIGEFMKQWNRDFETGETDIKFKWEDFWEYIFKYSKMKIDNMTQNFTAFLRIIHDLWDGFGALFTGQWEGVWTNIFDIFDTIWGLMVRDVEQKFGKDMITALDNALTSFTDTLQSWWANVSAWWNSTVGVLFGQMSAPLPTPNFAVVNPANTSGTSGGGTTNTIGAIHINVNGSSDPYQTGQAVGSGITDELRRRGYK